ncbi:MAG: hypothetical protein AB1585_20390 [Thermodesulfobacteriota bacterium]
MQGSHLVTMEKDKAKGNTFSFLLPNGELGNAQHAVAVARSATGTTPRLPGRQRSVAELPVRVDAVVRRRSFLISQPEFKEVFHEFKMVVK